MNWRTGENLAVSAGIWCRLVGMDSTLPVCLSPGLEGVGSSVFLAHSALGPSAEPASWAGPIVVIWGCQHLSAWSWTETNPAHCIQACSIRGDCGNRLIRGGISCRSEPPGSGRKERKRSSESAPRGKLRVALR